MVDVQREKDVEQLRRIARTQQIQIEHLLEVLQLKSAEIDALKAEVEAFAATFPTIGFDKAEGKYTQSL